MHIDACCLFDTVFGENGNGLCAYRRRVGDRTRGGDGLLAKDYVLLTAQYL